jgi:hypothetical protein
MASISGAPIQGGTAQTQQMVAAEVKKAEQIVNGTIPVPVATPETIDPSLLTPRPDANQPFIARDLEFATDWLSMLIYGDFGVGKTYLAGSSVFVEDYTDILYVALEGGEKGLKQLVKDGRARGIDVLSKILVIPVQTFKQYGNIYEFLKLHVKFRDSGDVLNLRRLEAQIKGYAPEVCKDDNLLAQVIPRPKMLRTVITDSLTEAQKYCMYQLLGIDPLKQRIDAEPDQAQYADWGRSREMIQFLVRRLRDLPINSIFICGQDTDQDAAKKWFYTPLLPGKLAGDVRGLVDCVGYLINAPQDGGTLARKLYMVGGWYGNANIAAKHRFGNNLKGPAIDNPSMQAIYDLDNK